MVIGLRKFKYFHLKILTTHKYEIKKQTINIGGIIFLGKCFTINKHMTKIKQKHYQIFVFVHATEKHQYNYLRQLIT